MGKALVDGKVAVVAVFLTPLVKEVGGGVEGAKGDDVAEVPL